MFEEKKRIPVGVENFEQIIKENYYYVDKTGVLVFCRKYSIIKRKLKGVMHDEENTKNSCAGRGGIIAGYVWSYHGICTVRQSGIRRVV